MPSYYENWQAMHFKCKHCDWQGMGNGLIEGECFSDLLEADCPSCHELVAVISFPTAEEARRNWDRVPETDKILIEHVEAMHNRFKLQCLKHPDQLPDLVGQNITLTWDYTDTPRNVTLIRYGDVEIWREPAIFEGYERYIEVLEILTQKYAHRLFDLQPTSGSCLFLYGDKIGAMDKIDRCREVVRSSCASIQ